MGRHTRPQQRLRRQERPVHLDARRLRHRDGEVEAGDERERRLGGRTRQPDLRQSGSGRRQSLCRHQQRQGLAETLSRRDRSGLPARLRQQERIVPLAGFQREAAHRPRARLAPAGHLLCTARGGRSALVRHQPRRGEVPRHRGLPRRRERWAVLHREGVGQRRSRRGLGARHDEAAGCVAAQHVLLQRDGRGRPALRQHQQRRGRGAHQSAECRSSQFPLRRQARRQGALGRRFARRECAPRAVVESVVCRTRRRAAGALRRRRRLALCVRCAG